MQQKKIKSGGLTETHIAYLSVPQTVSVEIRIWLASQRFKPLVLLVLKNANLKLILPGLVESLLVKN